jgi:hypothetical protein
MSILVGLGAVGLVIALVALVINPLVRFWRLDMPASGRSGIFAIYIFAILRNFTEADFLAPDSGSWLMLLIVIASLHAPQMINKAVLRP